MDFFGKRLIPARPRHAAAGSRLRSGLCSQAQLQSPDFQNWVVRIHEAPMHMHRKVWEWCYAAQALDERNMLTEGRRGIGFAVGTEPLPSLFASLGCQILATDVATEEARKGGWIETTQHADSLESLNRRGICDPDLFRQRVSFRFVDMRDLPDDLGTFDFVWSSCALEHLGNMALGCTFIDESMKYLKPGGVAVHTTEYNVQSNRRTVTEGPTVLFRKRDIQSIAANLVSRGHRVDLDFTEGDLPADRVVDKPPYSHATHLRVLMNDYIVTSYGLIVEA